SDDGLKEESLREVTTNTESSYESCQRRAQSHAVTVPPSIASRCRASRSQKAQTVFLVSYITTFKEQPYIRWCCIDLSNPPRLSGLTQAHSRRRTNSATNRFGIN